MWPLSTSQPKLWSQWTLGHSSLCGLWCDEPDPWLLDLLCFSSLALHLLDFNSLWWARWCSWLHPLSRLSRPKSQLLWYLRSFHLSELALASGKASVMLSWLLSGPLESSTSAWQTSVGSHYSVLQFQLEKPVLSTLSWTSEVLKRGMNRYF